MIDLKMLTFVWYFVHIYICIVAGAWFLLQRWGWSSWSWRKRTRSGIWSLAIHLTKHRIPNPRRWRCFSCDGTRHFRCATSLTLETQQRPVAQDVCLKLGIYDCFPILVQFHRCLDWFCNIRQLIKSNKTNQKKNGKGAGSEKDTRKGTRASTKSKKDKKSAKNKSGKRTAKGKGKVEDPESAGTVPAKRVRGKNKGAWVPT